MAYKSRTFTMGVDLDLDEVKEDVARLAKLTSLQRRALIEFLSDGDNLSLSDEAIGPPLVQFLRVEDIPPETFESTRDLLSHPMFSFEQDDDPEVVLHDLATIAPLGTPDDSSGPSVHDLLWKLLPAIRRAQDLMRCLRAVQSGYPHLVGVHFSADARLVPAHQFRLFEDTAESYVPRTLAFVPVGLVSLVIGENRKIQFQVDRIKLDNLIDQLQALRKEMVLVRDTLESAKLPARDVSTRSGDRG